MAELHVAHLGALERIGEEEAEATVSSVAASLDDAWQSSSAEPLAAPPSEGAFRWRRQEAEALRKLHTHLQCLNELLTFAPDEQKRLRVQLQQAQSCSNRAWYCVQQAAEVDAAQQRARMGKLKLEAKQSAAGNISERTARQDACRREPTSRTPSSRARRRLRETPRGRAAQAPQ